MKIKIKKLHPNAIIPSYAKEGDAGLDLTAISKTHDIDSNTTIYGFGLAVELPPGHFGMIIPRSSIYKKTQVLTNHCGIIDENFRGEIKAIFRDSTSGNFKYNRYNVLERIVQLIILPLPNIEIYEVDELSESNRGSNGFGSSGA